MSDIPQTVPTRGWRRIMDAFSFSFAGFRAAWRNEEAFRQETVLACFMIPGGCFLGTTGVERALLVGTCLLVLIVELLNSAIESLVDRIGQEHHDLSGRAKDMGSAAVFVSLTTTVTVWTFVLWDRFTG